MSADHAATVGRATIVRRTVFLTVLCAVCYFPGLTMHGLTNWQEGRRALVARQMHERGDWIVPTYFGEPYIAKPPLIYWVQLVIGRLREQAGVEAFADETEIRLTVALFGVLGVIVTYFAARPLLRGGHDTAIGEEAAWLSALGLAGGVLYVRSSRIGELDVLLVPFVVASVALVVRAWHVWEERGKTDWGSIALAALAATGAGLTKGPPAVLVIGLAGYGSILLLSRPGERSPGESLRTERRIGAFAALAGAILLVIAAWSRSGSISFPYDWFGVAFFAAVGAGMGGWIAALMRPAHRSRWFPALAHTHPLIVLGLPAIAVWLWSRAVAARVGAETVATLAATEVEDNLRILVLDSPSRNIGFMLYGVAPMSIAMLAGVWWIVSQRPVLSRGERVPLVWTGFGLIAFSMLGKGVARYLTPIWPGAAMVGGMWLARVLHDDERRRGHRRLRWAVIAVLVGSALAQGWWYAWGRERFYSHRSPRDFARELMPRLGDGPILGWRLSEPALEFYTHRRLVRLVRTEDLVESVRGSSGLVLLGREQHATQWMPALLGAGLSVTRLDISSANEWRCDGDAVGAWIINAL